MVSLVEHNILCAKIRRSLLSQVKTPQPYIALNATAKVLRLVAKILANSAKV